MTVHKSQGSEFDHAALILPAKIVPLVTRELVYTAITRAKQRLSIYADEQVLTQSIVARTERRSGLADILPAACNFNLQPLAGDRRLNRQRFPRLAQRLAGENVR